MDFSYNKKRECGSAAQRSVAMAQRGMVASSQHLATLSGYKALSRGGNAVDAAVAMVSTLSVVEPYSVGIGGDAFALIYLAKKDALICMNASGRAPYKATRDWFSEQGLKAIPELGMLPLTVPGALHGWAQAMESLGWGNCLKMQSTMRKPGSPSPRLLPGSGEIRRRYFAPMKALQRHTLLTAKLPGLGRSFETRI